MFSGAPRKSDVRSYLQKLCNSAGVQLQMTEIDLQISEEHDMSDEDRWQELITKIRNGEFDIIIMSPPCSTWSRAVWANRLGPKPVRSREFPFGFPWLKGDLKEKAELGTLLVMRCIETLEIAPAKTVCLWEHPEDLGRSRNGTPASVWQLEALRAVAKKRGMESIVFHQCTYGADYPKPTRFLSEADGLLQLGFSGWPILSKDLYYLGPLPRSCGHAHRALIGANDTGGFKTAPTAAYPPQMNEMIATLLFQHWHKHLPPMPDGGGVEKDAVAGVENSQDGDLGKEVEAEKARARKGPLKTQLRSWQAGVAVTQ